MTEEYAGMGDRDLAYPTVSSCHLPIQADCGLKIAHLIGSETVKECVYIHLAVIEWYVCLSDRYNRRSRTLQVTYMLPL